MGYMNLPAGRSLHRLAFWTLAAVALLVSHDAIWLVQLGPGQGLASALRSGGHGYWGAATVGLALVALIAIGAVGGRLWRLWSAARTFNDTRHNPTRRPAYFRRVRGAWPRLLAVVLIGFVLQENAEHALSHGHLPGLGVLLGPEHPLAIPVIGVVTLIGALLASAVMVTEDALLAVIGAAAARPRAPRRLLHPATGHRLSAISRPRAHAGRAPPGLLAPG